MVLLVLDIMPLAYIFMVGTALALVINFPKLRSQADEIVAHAPSIVGVVSMVLAAGVLVGVLNGTGMVTAMADWVVQVVPASMGQYLAVITGVLSIPMTFFMSNDAFYFGILPVLAESAATYGIAPVEMARASITGQPVHLQSPLVPAILLLVSLAGVNLGDHHKKVLWRATRDLAGDAGGRCARGRDPLRLSIRLERSGASVLRVRHSSIPLQLLGGTSRRAAHIARVTTVT